MLQVKSGWWKWSDYVKKLENFSMKPHSDFEEFLKLLEDHGVDYLIVGGYAVAFYGYPRFTKDLDILYLNQVENI